MKKTLMMVGIALLTVSVAKAAYVEMLNPWGNLSAEATWVGEVLPSGSSTGRVDSAISSAWTGSTWYSLAVRQEGGFIDASIGGATTFAMRGGPLGSGITTIYEIDDARTDYAAYTNLYAPMIQFWSHYGENMEMSLLSGHVEADLLSFLSTGHGTLNIGDGIFHGGIWEKGDVDVNMLAGGKGTISCDQMVEAQVTSLRLNFDASNLGSFTLGSVLAGGTNSTTIGIWEWMVSTGRVSIDGTVNSNASSYAITYDGFAGKISLPGALNPLEHYLAWTDSFELTGSDTSMTADIEPDGMDNLLEYALGGNPKLDDADQINPTFSGPAEISGTNYMEYVYNRRIDATARGLVYGVAMNIDDPVSPTWIDIDVETGSGPAADPLFESVTNAIPTGTDMGFINLKVTETF